MINELIPYACVTASMLAKPLSWFPMCCCLSDRARGCRTRAWLLCGWE